jgi:hypothetical protein
MSAEARYAKAQALADKQGALVGRVRYEIHAYRPMGRIGEWGEVLGVRPTRGVAISIHHFGTLVFAKARTPKADVVARWEAAMKEADALMTEQAGLDFFGVIVRPNCTIGNLHAHKRNVQLQRDGLTSPDEDAYIAMVGEFWAAHPNADSGTVSADGAHIEEYIPFRHTHTPGPKVDFGPAM